MKGNVSFRCVLCSYVYADRGRWDMPRCPRCGSESSLFPEWLARRVRTGR